MGADIHLVLERKVDDKWIGLHSFSWQIVQAISSRKGDFEHVDFSARDRNYARFAALAGVRGPGPVPKGLPADMSDLTRLELHDDGDLHSHTWYPIKFAAEIFARTEHADPRAAAVAAKLTGENAPRPPLLRFFGLYDDMDEDRDSLDNYRLCIAFDS